MISFLLLVFGEIGLPLLEDSTSISKLPLFISTNDLYQYFCLGVTASSTMWQDLSLFENLNLMLLRD